MKSKFTIKEIFADHWDPFLATSPRVRDVVLYEVQKVLQCGDLSKGYALYYCEECFKFKYVPFRCKSRFCNTCGMAYQQDRADSIASKLINCKHRHIVFTIPAELRILFRKDRKMLNILFSASAETIKQWMYNLNKSETFTPGIVSGLHTFGRDLKWNPHIHMLVTEGGSGNTEVWRDIRYFSYIGLRKRWQTTLLEHIERYLGKRKFRKIKNDLYNLNPEGFYVHAPPAEFNSPSAVVNYITRYIGRPVMAQSRIIDYDGDNVTFWYQRHEDDKKVVETLSAIEFIKKLIIHIPDKHFNMLRYYGLYAKHHKHEKEIILFISEAAAKIKKITQRWKFRISISFGYDPTKCSCGNYMELYKIVNFSSDIEPSPP